MNEELLMLYGAIYAVTNIMDQGSKSYSRRAPNGKWVVVDWVDILDFLTDLIEAKEKVREKNDRE